LLDSEAKIHFCSKGITSISGHETYELIGKSALELFHPADLPTAQKHNKYLIDFNENVSVSLVQLCHKQGSWVSVDVVLRNLLEVGPVNSFFLLLRRSSDADVAERKLVQAIIDAKEQERETLASELHDNVNQIITATKLLVDTARQSFEEEELLQLSSVNLQRAADEIRKLSYSMVSFDLQERGLAYTVNMLLSMVGKASGIKFSTRLDKVAVDAINACQQLHVYRIIQEGINNILRHSEATTAEIAISLQANLISIVIADNGKGFSLDRSRLGIGLSSISNRVKLLLGHFHVRPLDGAGAAIEIFFPVQTN
jgi:PAS domain S-box-containing protein